MVARLDLPEGREPVGRAQGTVARLRASRQGVDLRGLKAHDLIAEDRR